LYGTLQQKPDQPKNKKKNNKQKTLFNKKSSPTQNFGLNTGPSENVVGNKSLDHTTGHVLIPACQNTREIHHTGLGQQPKTHRTNKHATLAPQTPLKPKQDKSDQTAISTHQSKSIHGCQCESICQHTTKQLKACRPCGTKNHFSTFSTKSSPQKNLVPSLSPGKKFSGPKPRTIPTEHVLTPPWQNLIEIPRADLEL